MPVEGKSVICWQKAASVPPRQFLIDHMVALALADIRVLLRRGKQ
jgi:hypothetical protein